MWLHRASAPRCGVEAIAASAEFGIAFDRNSAALVGWVHDNVVRAELPPVAGSDGAWLHVALRSNGATLELLLDGAQVATCATEGARESAVKCVFFCDR